MIAEQVPSRRKDLRMLLVEVPFKAEPGGTAWTLVEVVVMMEAGTHTWAWEGSDGYVAP